MNGQLRLFEPNGSNGHRKTKAEAGVRREVPAGAERLLAELVQRGLARGICVSRRLCVALDGRDEEAPAG